MSYVKFPYQQVTPRSSMPLVWVRLQFSSIPVDTWVLVDTGAAVNVLPYSVGLRLGLNWEDFLEGPEIGGNASGATRTVVMDVSIGSFLDVPLSFCWLDNDRVRILFGHQNFFEQFVTYFDSKNKEFALFRNVEPS